MHAKSLQSCLTLCDPIDGSPPGSAVPGILQARTLEWVAISFSNAWKWKVKGKSLSRVWPLVTPWTAAYQAPPSVGFSRQEYWSGVPLPSPFKINNTIETDKTNWLYNSMLIYRKKTWIKQESVKFCYVLHTEHLKSHPQYTQTHGHMHTHMYTHIYTYTRCTCTYRDL